MKLYSKNPEDPFLHFVLEFDDLCSGCAAAVDDRQSVFAGDADSTVAEAFMKACAFHQPGCRNLHVSIRSRLLRGLLLNALGKGRNAIIFGSDGSFVDRIRPGGRPWTEAQEEREAEDLRVAFP